MCAHKKARIQYAQSEHKSEWIKGALLLVSRDVLCTGHTSLMDPRQSKPSAANTSTFLYQNLQGTRLFWNGIVYSTILKKIIQVCTILRVKEKFWFFWHPDIMVHKYYFCVKTSAEYFSENHEQESRESKSRGSCKFTPPLFVLVGPQF